jgi:hypothetical protein
MDIEHAEKEHIADGFYSLDRPSVKDLFWDRISEQRKLLMDGYIEHGEDVRFKVQMIDEIVSYKDDLENLLKG